MGNNQLLRTYLDMVRGSAAFLVVFGHAKLHVFGQQTDFDDFNSIYLKGVIATGAFAHYAVVVFFVLSGYLVGGKLYKAARKGFVAKYLLDRATRIYIVALPAMVIAFLLMVLQQNLYGHAFSLTSSNCNAEPSALVTSMFFLHTGIVSGPCFNGPYWSLVYEVFYYLFFLSLAIAWLGSGLQRILAIVTTGMLAIYGLFEPGNLYAYSTLWLLGMAVAQQHPFRGKGASLTGVIFTAFALQTLLRLHDPRAIYEFVAGLLIATSIVALQRWEPFFLPRSVSVVAAFGAASSYSLYLFHAPILNLSRGIMEGSFGIVLGQANVAAYWYPALISMACLLSWGCWWLFEKRTTYFRFAIERRLGITQKHQSIPPNEVATDGSPLQGKEASQMRYEGSPLRSSGPLS